MDPLLEFEDCSFSIVKKLGEGSFGRVYEVIYKPTGEAFAMKALSKRQAKEKEGGTIWTTIGTYRS